MEAADQDDFGEMVDALADILVVTYGAAVEMGVDLEPFFGRSSAATCLKMVARTPAEKSSKVPDSARPTSSVNC